MLGKRREKKGRTPSRKTLLLCSWQFILSSVPPEIIDTNTAIELYKTRWQVELLIKRLKSLLDIDQLRARKDSQLAELYLNGKLLYAAVIEKQMRCRFEAAATTMDAPRNLTCWRLCRSTANEFNPAIKSCFPAQPCFIHDCIKSLTERPRRRKLQELPERIINVIEYCRAKGMSRV